MYNKNNVLENVVSCALVYCLSYYICTRSGMHLLSSEAQSESSEAQKRSKALEAESWKMECQVFALKLVVVVMEALEPSVGVGIQLLNRLKF